MTACPQSRAQTQQPSTALADGLLGACRWRCFRLSRRHPQSCSDADPCLDLAGTAQRDFTDDNEVVGQFTLAGTTTLVLTAVSVLASAEYLLARQGLPARRRGRVLVWAAVGATFGSITAVRDADSFDYGQLGPQWLSVPMFLALPAVTAAATAYVIEVWDQPEHWFHTGRTWTTLIPGGLVMAVFYLFAIPIIGLGVLIAVLVRRVSALSRLWSSHAVTILARLCITAILAIGVVDITRDLQSML